METIIKIITLHPDSEKVRELTSQLTGQGLKYEIVDGVDGREAFPSLEEGESIGQLEALKIRQVELTKSEVGCYLSHFRTIKKSYTAGFERVCILEDDVLIEPDFGEVFRSLENLSDEFEHIRFMGLKLHRRKNVCQIGKRHQLTRPIKGVCGAQGYIINRCGMEKVLQKGHVITEPIDKFYDHFWNTKLRSYCVEPHIIWERPIIKSSIVKASRYVAAKPLGKRLRKHIIKLQRGFKRRVYILKHWSDFLPAKKPDHPMGKTSRIR
jgi:glycosyl transferase family 25